MGAVSELYSVEHLHTHQLVDRAVDGRPPDARVGAPQLLEQLVRGKRRAGLSQADQVLRYRAPRVGLPFSELLERFVDPFLDVH